MPHSGLRCARTGLAGALASLVGCTSQGLDWPDSPRDPEAEAAARELESYKSAFSEALGTGFDTIETRVDFLDQLASARVVFLGDNHRDPALHDRHVALLQDLHERGAPVALVLEAVGTDDQEILDEFARGDRSLANLRAAIQQRWAGSWLDDVTLDRAYYNELLDRARACRWPIYALEPTPRLPLPQRDATMAERVRAVTAAHPDRQVVVVVGQTHLLGQGGLLANVGDAGAIGLGASVSPALRAAAIRRDAPPGSMLRSEGGLWFFADHLPIHP